LVVRSELLRDRVAAAIEGARINVQVESSPSYLSAMGWLTRERVDVVIGPVSGMTGMVGSTAKALRRLAPGTRLVAVAESQQRAEAAAALSAGFDCCIYEPADATQLLASMRIAMTSLGTAVIEPLAGKHADVEPVPRARSSTNTLSVPDQDWLRFAFEEPEIVPSDEGMGDVDLVEAVMRSDGSLVSLAMQLLREQSGLNDAVFVPSGGPPVEQGTKVEVSYAGKMLGTLSSQMQKVDSLGSWAAWLARWLAIDYRQGELYRMAMRDELTGLWNRRYFNRFLERVIKRAAEGRQQVTLLIFDIDNFKRYNDSYGHPAGDEILKSTARLIQSLVREHDVVARIGGDEFACIFWDKGEPRHLGSHHPDNVIAIAKRFQKAIWDHRFPKLGKDAVDNLTVSGGLAGFPWDGRSPAELIARADAMALKSKRQGKNAICFGPGAAPNGNTH